MATVTASEYRKTQPPEQGPSHYEYLEQNLRAIETSIRLAVADLKNIGPFVATYPQVSQSANYTLVLSDAGKHILHPSSDNNPRTFTIPANSSVAFPTGTIIKFVNAVNTLSIAITTDTLRLAGGSSTGTRTLGAYGVAEAIKIDSTTWVISGTNLT
jgi:hypothetical protein